MSHDSETLAELTAAKRDRDRAKELMQRKRGELGEARQAYKNYCTAVEEILEEITGDRPLIAAINARAAADPPPADPPPKKRAKRERSDAKLTGLEMPTAKETLDALTARRVAESVESTVPAPADAPDRTSGPAKAVPPARSTEDVDAEFFHAITHNYKTRAPLNWSTEIVHGATNDQIKKRIMEAWPSARMFQDRKQTGTREGYTLGSPGGEPAFWVGAIAGPFHVPDLRGASLIGHVRALLEIPTPHQIANLREPKITAEGTGGNAQSAPPTGKEKPRASKRA